MIVTARLDVTESGRYAVPDGQAEIVTALIYGDNDNAPIQAALDAIARCRLVTEGNASAIDIKPAVAVVHCGPHMYHLPETGTEIVRADGQPVLDQ